MSNFVDIKDESKKENNPNWQQLSDYLYRILMNRSLGSKNKCIT